ncbi:hypothetical protein Poli38472_004026 [Pythium oligandrum]|uniref:Helicase-associated domain-containing protein n=1 Tax=Pythium oligandrum TaxID=41045 RepID=A0A8K1CMB2_PYTOL|nr:hypothetical protein Poli38472_004026 [Pythium oligandrum]|eukprot:TMW66261.1 hypothetical protein Poli38472_004026 [Pythium oligandrum]
MWLRRATQCALGGVTRSRPRCGWPVNGLLINSLRPQSTSLSQRFYGVRSSTESRLRGRKRSSPHTSNASQAKRSEELARIVQAMRIFYEREQHFAVPIGFEIPRASPHYPSELRGFPLGVKIHKLMQLVANDKPPKGSREHITALAESGFPVESWRDYLFDTVFVPALRSYYSQEGDLFVPQKFVVPVDPSEAQWTRPTWGYPLGLQVAKLRREPYMLSPEQVEMLNAMGFVWNVREAKWHQYFLPGLRLFKELHGHADVPLAFEIPDEDAWPKYLRGYRLGRHVYMVRSGKYAEWVEESKGELEMLGFAFDLSDSLWNYTIFPALEMFAHLHGHCDVPQDFVVPAEDPWPETAYGWRLGHTVKSIRHQGVYKAQVQAARVDLERIGFVWNASDRLEVTLRRIVLPAMKTYQNLNGNLLIGTDFVIPEHDGRWPEQARGFRLGHWITRVRGGQIELPRAFRDELDQLGFVWRFNDERWHEILLPAFRVYAELHGSCKGMSTKYVVPHETPYPRRAWGVNLGGAMWHIKNGDTYMHDPVKERELRKLGVL